MRISKCRGCESRILIKLFSLGNLHFTGKFASASQKIKKKTNYTFNVQKMLISSIST